MEEITREIVYFLAVHLAEKKKKQDAKKKLDC